jgi:UrcA family protein
MNTKFISARSNVGRAALGAALAAGLAVPVSPALAQGRAGQAASTTSAVTVIAPRITKRREGKVEVLSLQRTVNFADLDLKTRAGVDEFDKRIMYAALAACDQLEQEYPSRIYLPVPPTQNCADATASAALTTAKVIIAAARSK